MKSIITRIEALEADAVAKKIPVPLFACIIDGAEVEMRALDYAYMIAQGHAGSMGGQCGITYIDEPSRISMEELDAAFDEMEREYNSPAAEAQRKAEYEEIQRLGELRRMDCLCGRDMDICHPLPWQQAKYDGGKRPQKGNL